MHASRRSLLKTLLIGAGALPCLGRGGRVPSAFAATSGAPRRLVLINTPNGSSGPSESSALRPGASWETTKLGPMFAPLERHKKDVVVTLNTEFKLPSGYMPPSSSHGFSCRALYTGSVEVVAGRAQNASIDQYVGAKLAGVTRFPVLLPGVQASTTCSFGADGRPIGHQADPYQLFKQLFSDALAVGNVDSTAGTKALLARRKSILDALTQDVTTFKGKLGREDRERADIQLEAIRSLERRLVPADGGGAGAACRAPAMPPAGLETRSTFSKDVPRDWDAKMKIAVAALACDLTRVVNIQTYGEDLHSQTCNFPPLNTSNGWHALSHGSGGAAAYTAAKAWLCEQVATLADALKAIPEGDGTMLDHTLIWLAQEMGDSHTWYGFPQAFVGGRGLGVKTGQSIRCGENRSGAGTEQNRLLVAILNAMGLPDQTYGKELTAGRGPLKGFLA